MKKIRAAVVGYGNIGQYTVQALEAADDFEIAGIVRRNGAENKPQELAQYDVVKDITELKDVDVAILRHSYPRIVRNSPRKFFLSESILSTVLISTRISVSIVPT